MPSDPVRPFRSRVVRQDRAADVVTPMVDALDDSIPDLRPGNPDAAAYAESPAALYVYRQGHGSDVHSGNRLRNRDRSLPRRAGART